MKLIGNYSNIIRPSWAFDMLTKEGDKRPNQAMVKDDDSFKEQREAWQNAGYELENSSVEWHIYWDKHITEPLDTEQLEITKGKRCHWWFVKLMPGKCFPQHKDYFADFKNPVRYWMAMENYKWGHVFLIGDKQIKDYKEGDLFRIENDWHAAANIGLVPKLSIQLVVDE